MPFKTAVQARWNAVRSWRPDREKRWHYVFMLFSWACFIFACWRTWQVVYGRMYYLLDSDMSSELVLSHLLRQEHKIVTQDWFYSTELRVFNSKGDIDIDGKRLGLILDVGGYYKNVITLAPSLEISYAEIDLGIALLDRLLHRAMQR